MNLEDLGITSLEFISNEYAIKRDDILDKTIKNLSHAGITTDRLPLWMGVGILNFRKKSQAEDNYLAWSKFREAHNYHVKICGQFRLIEFDPANYEYLGQILVQTANHLHEIGARYAPQILKTMKENNST